MTRCRCHIEEPDYGAVLLKAFLQTLELDPGSEHLIGTPERISRFYSSWLAKGHETFRFTTFEAPPDADFVMVGDLVFHSMCSHHFVPFFGRAHIAYLPGKRLAGLSKLGRTLRMFSHRPQVQEQLTREVAEYLNDKLEPKGVAVILQAEHLCMSMRGVEMPGHQTVTECVLGDLRDYHLNRFHKHIQLIRKESQ